MEGKVKGLLIAVLALLVFAIVANIAIAIYQPYAVKNAVKATTSYNQTVNGVEYEFAGTGDSPQQAGQDAVDSMNTIRVTVNIILGVVFLVLLILGAVSLFSSKKNY
jgi:Tfp pilus assembly major pilin PilA